MAEVGGCYLSQLPRGPSGAAAADGGDDRGDGAGGGPARGRRLEGAAGPPRAPRPPQFQCLGRFEGCFHFEALISPDGSQCFPIELNGRLGGAECPASVEATTGHWLPLRAAESALGVPPRAPPRFPVAVSLNPQLPADVADGRVISRLCLCERAQGCHCAAGAASGIADESTLFRPRVAGARRSNVAPVDDDEDAERHLVQCVLYMGSVGRAYAAGRGSRTARLARRRRRDGGAAAARAAGGRSARRGDRRKGPEARPGADVGARPGSRTLRGSHGRGGAALGERRAPRQPAVRGRRERRAGAQRAARILCVFFGHEIPKCPTFTLVSSLFIKMYG